MEEFLLSDGAERQDLQRVFAGVKERGGVDKYFEGMIDLEAIRRQLSRTHLKSLRRSCFKEASLAIKRKADSCQSCQSLLEACECGLKLNSEDAEMYAGLGWALVRLGRHDEARQALSDGLRFAASWNAKAEIVKMMEDEMKALKIEATTDTV